MPDSKSTVTTFSRIDSIHRECSIRRRAFVSTFSAALPRDFVLEAVGPALDPCCFMANRAPVLNAFETLDKEALTMLSCCRPTVESPVDPGSA